METECKQELLSLSLSELEEWMVAAGEPKYRAKQLFPQLHRGLSPDEMTNLGKRLQEKLRNAFLWHLPVVEQRLASSIIFRYSLMYFPLNAIVKSFPFNKMLTFSLTTPTSLFALINIASSLISNFTTLYLSFLATTPALSILVKSACLLTVTTFSKFGGNM